MTVNTSYDLSKQFHLLPITYRPSQYSSLKNIPIALRAEFDHFRIGTKPLAVKYPEWLGGGFLAKFGNP